MQEASAGDTNARVLKGAKARRGFAEREVRRRVNIIPRAGLERVRRQSRT
jgi:hypothetical protein